MAAINDFRGYPEELRTKEEGPSVIFREVMVDGWPHLFVTANREIMPGEEILADYGTVLFLDRNLQLLCDIGIHSVAWVEAQPYV